MAYSPKYVQAEEIPVQVPDDFNKQEKLDALELAEQLIEIDINDGSELSTVTTLHEAAIKQRATCELVKGTEDNDDVALGDLDDTGQTKSNYAQTSFCDNYDEIIQKMRDHIEGQSTGPYVYTTSPSDDWEEWSDLQDDLDIDIEDI